MNKSTMDLAREYYDFYVRIFQGLKENEKAGKLNSEQKKLMTEFEDKVFEIKNTIDSGNENKCLIMVFDGGEPWRSTWIKRFRDAEERGD